MNEHELKDFVFCTLIKIIARGYRQFDHVLDAWYLSSGHMRNLLSSEASLFGFTNVNTAWVLLIAALC